MRPGFGRKRHPPAGAGAPLILTVPAMMQGGPLACSGRGVGVGSGVGVSVGTGVSVGRDAAIALRP